MTKPVKNIAASVRAKLLEYARKTEQDFQFVLDRWARERFLFRLGQSKQHDQFVLKGATLFLIWKGQLARPTRDVDLLGYGSPEVKDVVAIVTEICLMDFTACAFWLQHCWAKHEPNYRSTSGSEMLSIRQLKKGHCR